MVVRIEIGGIGIPARAGIGHSEAEEGTHVSNPVGIRVVIGIELSWQIGAGMNVDPRGNHLRGNPV